jgi:hypothetical protein
MKFFAALSVIGMLMISGGWFLKQRHQVVSLQAIHSYGETCAHYEGPRKKISEIHEATPTGSTFVWVGVVLVLLGGVGYGLLYADRKRKEHEIALKAMESE